MNLRHVAPLLLPSILASSSGCYGGETAGWTVNEVRRPTSTGSVRYGSKLSLGQADASDGIAFQVGETPQCRGTKTGDTYAVRSGYLYQNFWPVIPAAVGLGGGSLLLAISGASESLSNSLATGGAVMMGVGALSLLTWLIMPSRISGEEEERLGAHTSWKGPPVACGNTKPFRMATTVTLDLATSSSRASLATWTFQTDGAGVFRSTTAIPTAKRIAAYCGAVKLTVSDGSAAVAHVETDVPDAFTPVSAQHGRAVEMTIVATGARPTLASMSTEDPTAEKIARACCEQTVVEAEDSGCTRRCLAAGGLDKCGNGMHACESLARSSDVEFRGGDLAMCNSYLSICLTRHQSSPAFLGTCKAMCTSKKVLEACQ